MSGTMRIEFRKLFVSFVAVVIFASPLVAVAADPPPLNIPSSGNPALDAERQQQYVVEYNACLERGVSASACVNSATERVRYINFTQQQLDATDSATNAAIADTFAPCAQLSWATDPAGKAACYAGGAVVGTVEEAVSGIWGGLVGIISEQIFSLENIFWVGSMIAWLALMIAQVFLAWSSWWLDGAIYYTVVLMGAFINDPLTQTGIVKAWSIVRDFTNIAIIAGFVAVGISTILNISQYAADKFLSRLIIAALLVNFSYFFAGAAIDASNYVAKQIYYSDFMKSGCPVNSQEGNIQGIGGVLNTLWQAGGDPSHLCSVGASFLKSTKIIEWTNIEEIAAEASQHQGGKNLYWTLMILGLFGALFAGLTSWIFMQAAFMLFVRFAALILALIASPIGIAGINIPLLDRFAGRWWSLLASQAIFAPVFIFLVAVGLNVIKSLEVALGTGDKTFTGAVTHSTYEAGSGVLVTHLPLFIVYFIGIAFMYLALQFSKQLAQSVPELKTMYDLASKQATGLWLSPVRYPQGLANRFGLTSGLATQLEKAAAEHKEGSWARGTFATLATGVRATGKLGTKQKEGAKSSGDEVYENIADYRKERYKRDTRPAIQGGLAGWLRQPAFAPFGQTNILDIPKDKRTPQQQEDLESAMKTITKDNVHEKLTPKQIKQALGEKLFTDEQKKAIFDSDAFSEGDKAGFRKAILSDIASKVEVAKTAKTPEDQKAAWAAVGESMRSLSDIDLEILRTDRKDLQADEQFLGAMRHQDYERFTKGMSESEKQRARAARTKGLESELRSNDEDRINAARDRMSDDDVRRLDTATMTDQVITNLRASQLKTRLDNLTESPADKAERARILRLRPELAQPGTRLENPAPPPAPPQPPRAAPSAAAAPARPTPPAGEYLGGRVPRTGGGTSPQGQTAPTNSDGVDGINPPPSTNK